MLKPVDDFVTTSPDQLSDKSLNYMIDRALFYQRSTIIENKCHYELAHKYENYNLTMNVIVSILSTIVGTSIFTTLLKTKSTEENYSIIIVVTGFLSVTAAVLSTLQTVLRFADKATKHKKSANEFEVVFNLIQTFLMKYISLQSTPTEQLRTKALEEMNKIMALSSAASKDAPTIPTNIIRKHSIMPEPLAKPQTATSGVIPPDFPTQNNED
ncbi:SLATT domain-containing protein [Mucilaginibacter ginsenosidivorax]|uniref:SLATT domain-containing protein n=1 Tax=Mucilaginibacter ginsenosidivorax TaxID=862126 RepID=A0A5B8W5Q5_9SPHI|nr:SLATT domain-containing protein [Mucilaginibacter ginsenosidivorax]QEC78767.1 SLATT domain-containing protein [Mucilaginibacter ginsenosidivorax]